MKKLTVLTVVLAIALLLPFSIPAQTAENTTTPEPIDQGALSVQTKTVMVPRVNITGTTGFEQESRKFIKALNEGGLDNVGSYLHPRGVGLSSVIAIKKTESDYHLMNYWFQKLNFDKFINIVVRSKIQVVVLYHGSLPPVGEKKNAELKKLPKEKGLKQLDAIKPIPVTLGIVWIKDEGEWSIAEIKFLGPQPKPKKTPVPTPAPEKTPTTDETKPE